MRPSETAEKCPALELRGVRHGFGAVEVLSGIDLRLAPAEVLGLVGPSGCGKSTLLELVAGLAEPLDGTIAVHGAARARERLRGSVLMPQRDALLPWLSALDNAALGPRIHGSSRASARRRALPLFARFGLAGFERSRPSQLSGGMRQRVAFLRTLLAEKSLLLLDEPFGSLDAITRVEMQEWLAGALAQERRSVVLVTHDVEEALYLCDRVVILSPRPAQIIAELAAERARNPERARAVSAPSFVRLREKALAALRGGGAEREQAAHA